MHLLDIIIQNVMKMHGKHSIKSSNHKFLSGEYIRVTSILLLATGRKNSENDGGGVNTF